MKRLRLLKYIEITDLIQNEQQKDEKNVMSYDKKFVNILSLLNFEQVCRVSLKSSWCQTEKLCPVSLCFRDEVQDSFHFYV